MKKIIRLSYESGQKRWAMQMPVGWLLLIALALGVIVLAGPIATRWSGAESAHGAVSAEEAFRNSPDYEGHMLGLRTTQAKIERKRKRDERYQRKLNAKLSPELRAALGAK